MASFPDMLAEDRQQAGFTVGQVAWRIGVSPAVYRELEAGTAWPSSDAYHAISALFGWPETFVGPAGQVR